ncbi:Negative regulator of mitotic exit [Linnemannia zychae]|nr:Negative regulator of mitotic exit [Linnemannia zychae]
MRYSLRTFVGLGILTIASIPPFTHSQPQPCGGAAFAKVGSTFYIQGGASFGDNLIQAFWALDLSVPWTVSAPAWTAITPPGPYNAFHSAGVSSDGSSFITFGRDTAADQNQIAASWINTFSIGSKTWSATTPPNLGDDSRRDFQAVTNLAGGKIYILGGNAGRQGTVSSNVLSTYDPSTGSLIETPMPSNAPQNSSTYAAVWIKRSASMLLIGGISAGNYPQSLWSYNPISGGWSTQSSNGPFNQGRISHCAASNADGSIVAVYGGFVGGSTTADPYVYLLDTTTWTWTAIPVASGRGRGNAACTIIDDTFIVWGGFYNNPSQQGGLPGPGENLLLLSLSTGQWKTSYTPSGIEGAGKRGISGGAIGGICAGIVVIIAAVIAFLYFRRTWKKGDDFEKESATSAKKSSHLETGTAGNNGASPTNGHGQHEGTALISSSHSPQPASSSVSPTIYDQPIYHHPMPQPQPAGYIGYDPYQQQQQQQQYPAYLQQSTDHTFHHRPSVDVYPSTSAGAEDVQYVDENGHLYRRSYQPTVMPVPVITPGQVYYPLPPPGQDANSSEAPYKASINEESAPNVDSSAYHDSYAPSAAITTPGDGVKRPVSGPQGVRVTEEPVSKGAPQAILQ